MPKALVSFVLATLTALLVLASPRPARACTCIEPTVQEELASATSVFEGRVLSVVTEGSGWYPVRAELEVERAWKGAATGQKIAVYTGTWDGTCGFPFQVGANYLVFARTLEGQLRTSTCGHTGSSQNSQAVIEELGPPTSGEPPACALTRGGTVSSLSAVWLVAVTLLAWRVSARTRH